MKHFGKTPKLDTPPPAGKAMFQMLGVFAESERSIIRERVDSRPIHSAASRMRAFKARAMSSDIAPTANLNSWDAAINR